MCANYLELSGPQFRPLNDAIRATFNLNQFDRTLRLRLDWSREDIALGNDYTDIVHRVIDHANRRGLVYQFVIALQQERPSYPVFLEYANIVGVGVQGLPNYQQLESIISKTNALLDIETFRSRIGEIEGQVCRIDLNKTGMGTGFLVGPSAVITNYHVIEKAVAGDQDITNYSCLFDYKTRSNGSVVNQGNNVPVSKLLTHSSYDEIADLKSSAGDPSPNKLDFALLLLDGEPGNEPIGGVFVDQETPMRGRIKLPTKTYEFEPQTPLFIVQHPDAKPMKLALDTEAIIGLNGNKTRVTYKTNTEPGSSGSPCFNQNWELVALHHSGDPKWVPTWNRGIPINLITEMIVAKGLEKYIA
ncbi:MAG: serine protease [Anaerolineaceae bacterium]|nr:serine protease [Anaerolineaceae bacterium]